MRCSPRSSVSRRRFLPEMHAVDPTTHIEFEPISTLPGFDTHGGSEIAELGKACCGAQRHRQGFVRHARPRCSTTPAFPTIICGPGHIAQAHQPNEWVTLEQLALCEAFMRRLADRVLRVLSRSRGGRSAPEPPPSATTRAASSRSTSRSPISRRHAEGNAGIAYAWTFDSGRPGPHVSAPGADPRQRSLRRDRARLGRCASGVRPTRGTLSIVFANVAAYRRFDRSDPFASRCVDEDFNRLWTRRGSRRTARQRRAATRARAEAALRSRRLSCSTCTRCPSPARRSRWQARGARGSRSHARSVRRSTWSSTAATQRAGGCATTRSSTTMPIRATRCSSSAASIGKRARRRSRRNRRCCAFCAISAWRTRRLLDAHLDAAPAPAQNLIEITTTVTIATDDFAFAFPGAWAADHRRGGNALATDGGSPRSALRTTTAC